MTTPEVVPRTGVDRRRFFGLVGGGAAAVGLVGCADDGPQFAAPAAGGAPVATQAAAAPEPTFDDRSESIIPEFTRIADLEMADDGPSMTYVPEVPPPPARTDQRIVEFALDVIEGECPIDPPNDVTTLMWGFRIAGDRSTTCGSPGPVMRARVGDLARITVNNLADNVHPHNIDFHAVTGQGGGAEGTTLPPGESATINCRLLYPGVFMYHCAFGDVPEHIVHGMYGIFIVDPEEPLPVVDHEWAIAQSEWYLDDAGDMSFDRDRLLLEHPTFVTFNGRTDALIGDNALQMNVGERARFYMVNEGLNLDSNFHPIGSHWDVVYPEAATHPVNRVIRGSQSTLVVAGGGTVTELIGQVPSTIILVDHALVRTFYKGCIGQVVISGDENAIYSVGDEGLAAAAEGEPAPPPRDDNSVAMPAGAWDPANAETAYTPRELSVPVGTTVVWYNDDSVVHTVTSGPSDGTNRFPDGAFDSGDMQPGQSWSYQFDQAGTFDYHCTPHPWMFGAVEVTA